MLNPLKTTILIQREENMHNRYDFLNSLQLSEEVVGRLSNLLHQTETGNDVIYKTPLGENNDPDVILAKWDKVFQANSHKMNEVLLEIEDGQRSKFGPRSIQIPWDERKPLVEAYFEAVPDRDYTGIDTAPVKAAGLRPLSLSNAMSYLKNATNSGLPFYVKKGRVKDQVLSDFENLLNRKEPCIMFTRTQEQRKTRAVWGFPIADTLNEMRFYRPVLDFQKQLSWRAAIRGPEHVDMAVTKLINAAQSLNQQLVSIDFSSYDATLQKQIQEASFSYLKQLFQPGFSSDMDYIADRFNTIGLITPEGVWDRPHGVPSGSTFTNEVDSVAQFLLARASNLTSIEDCQIQGDDGAYRTTSPEELMKFFTTFGLNVNEEKSDVSDDYLIYLQNLHHIDYRSSDGIIRGIYPVYRALNRLIFQERFDDFSAYELEGKDFYAIRTLAILENCRNHPLFRDFVEFIHSMDKYGLKPSQQGIDKYVKMLKDKTGAEGIIQHQYGDQITGIRSFESYKIVSEL